MLEPEQVPPAQPTSSLPDDVDLKHLSVLSIHMHELFTHLQRHGFSKDEALTLTGMVLSSNSLYKFDIYSDITLDIEDDQDFGGLDGEDFA